MSDLIERLRRYAREAVTPYDRAHYTEAADALEKALEALSTIMRHWEAYTDPDADMPGWPDDAAGVMNDAYKDGFYDKARTALSSIRGDKRS